MNLIRRSIINPILDFLYPPICLICNEPLEDPEEGVCRACWSGFTGVSPGHPAWVDLQNKFARHGYVQGILSCYLFEKEGGVQGAIHMLKYQGVKSIGERLGRELGSRISSSPVFAQAHYLVPVPLNNVKQRERGYNQTDYICAGITSITNIPVNTSILRRNKYTRSQTGLNLQQREANVDGAFGVDQKHQSIVDGKIIIIVDDVITTGATINACAKELLAHQAQSIHAVSVALAS